MGPVYLEVQQKAPQAQVFSRHLDKHPLLGQERQLDLERLVSSLKANTQEGFCSRSMLQGQFARPVHTRAHTAPYYSTVYGQYYSTVYGHKKCAHVFSTCVLNEHYQKMTE